MSAIYLGQTDTTKEAVVFDIQNGKAIAVTIVPVRLRFGDEAPAVVRRIVRGAPDHPRAERVDGFAYSSEKGRSVLVAKWPDVDGCVAKRCLYQRPVARAALGGLGIAGLSGKAVPCIAG